MTKRIVLKILLLVCCLAKVTIAQSNTSDSFLPTAFNGELIEIMQAPYTAAIYLGELYRCTGSLIKRQWVLTSGYCVMGNLPQEFKVMMGSKELNDLKNIEEVIKVVVHPDFVSMPLKNDVGLLGLKKSFTMGKIIDVIELTSTPFDPNKVETCNLAGWGSDANRTQEILVDDIPVLLRRVKMELVKQNSCKKNFTELTIRFGMEVVDDTTICAKGTHGDVCLGDLGAALICQKKQVGIASVLIKECGSAAISLYTQVYHFKPWIEENMDFTEKSMSPVRYSIDFILPVVCTLVILFIITD